MATTDVLGLPLMADGERIPYQKFNEAMRKLDARFAVASSLEISLVAFWRLTEASGTRSDSWGSNHLTDNNTVTGAVGKIGNACQFTAANSEYLSIADNAALSMGDFDFSIAGWVYLDSLGVLRWACSKGTSVPVQEYGIYVDTSNQVNFFVSSNGTATANLANTSVTLTTATWYFICAWHDSVANTINLSVNNGTAASMAHTTGVFNGATAFILGASGGPAQFWDGRLDAWGVWKKVLSAGERTTLYNGGTGLETPFS